jgi:hypothetical protein
MPSRGRHQSTSKECQQAIQRLESLDAVTAVIIGRSYGGKSLGKGGRTGAIKLQRQVPGGWKAVTQTAKGLQEIFIQTRAGQEKRVHFIVSGWAEE